ncbi:bifunctional monodehydroascorbate reductase and carbonic [Musa troglodytarum]|uniref:Carbonic anhydrase n=1 Tax=Musa troglodytarum TaxID=320322 RepID=A0A9E7G493_9LILI|nr:bifunctional monodehydroascorbate reductase and carbonic [Musa troglodytarum]
MGHHKPVIIFSFLAILILRSVLVASQEVEDEKEFSYEKGSEAGPEHWGEIHRDWAACGKGHMQSPIDLTHKRVQILPHLGRLRRSYHPAKAILKNRGHDIMLKWEEEAGGLWINGTEYALKQLHWHSPSEHTIDGRRYSLEMHMVHESTDNKIAVVGILYTIGRHDPFLAKLERYIEKIADKNEAEEAVGMVDPRHIKRGSRKYYRYMGSLTTPPCTEGVVWTIVKKVRTVTREQVALLREAVHDDSEMNARPTQKINDRMIGLYRPRPHQQ